MEKAAENEKRVELRLAKISDTGRIHLLMQEVYEELQDKSIFICDDLDHVRKYIEGNGFGVVGVISVSSSEGEDYAKSQENGQADEEIVSSLIVQFPGLNEDNLGRDMGLSEGELLKVAHFESAVVRKDCRGQGLERRMAEYAERNIDISKYRYFMATVSPDNPASYKTAEKLGYKCIAEKEKYGGYSRRIYLKEVGV